MSSSELIDTLFGDMDGNDAELRQRLQGQNHEALIIALKQRADERMDSDVQNALRCGQLIIQIGRMLNQLSYVALGTMVIGDATYSQGDPRAAWDILEEAGKIFKQADDEVGWARTRIGRTRLGVPLDRVALVLEDADTARQILTKHERWDRLMILLLNLGALHDQMRNYPAALEQYDTALHIVEKLPAESQLVYRAWLSDNIGCVHINLGNAGKARKAFTDALAGWEEANQPQSQALTILNLALLDQFQGKFRQALTALHKVVPLVSASQAVNVKLNIIHCYLELRDYTTVCELAVDFINDCKQRSFLLEASSALLSLADAHAELGNFAAAKTALDEASELAPQRSAETWQGVIQLRRAYIALKTGDVAYAQACLTTLNHRDDHHYVSMTRAILQGEFAYLDQQYEAGKIYGEQALNLAQKLNWSRMEYRSRLLLARLHEQARHESEALHEYAAAADIVDHVQRGLTITFRPSWLEDNKDALHAVVGLHLTHDDIPHTTAAFEAIERLKSQVLLGYMLNRDALKWSPQTPAETSLVDQLNDLRSQYQRLLDQIDTSEKPATQERHALERQMRTITERLFLAKPESAADVSPICLDQIMPCLPPASTLLEYFDDGQHLWAFTVSANTITRVRLGSSADMRETALRARRYINRAVAAGPHSASIPQLRRQTDKELQALYRGLIEPLVSTLRGTERLYIVPYGFLHTIPFHLLFDGTHYLNECYEVVVEPAAGLLTWTPRPQPRGTRAIAHTADGRLPYAVVEGQRIVHMMGGVLYQEQDAKRDRLMEQPTQILHIAAHGAHHPQQPSLSFIQLADGPLWADDVFQYDMNYELVTLSACETGRVQASGGDELIGLGRGFLYAGAGALLTSLWQVNDAIAVDFMQSFYGELLRGRSKAFALRFAQQTLFGEDRTTHPAFWGAFQLVGNADALS